MKSNKKLPWAYILITVLVLAGASYAIAALRQISHEDAPVTIGILNYTHAADTSVIGFRQRIKELGYIEGENLNLLYSGVIAESNKLEKEAQRLVIYPVDLLVTMSTPATLIAKKAVGETSIPIVFGPVSNPIENGIVKSFRHPGEPITGVMFGLQEEKRLELLTIIDPAIRKLYVPYSTENESTINALRKLETTAEKLELELVLGQIHKREDLNVVLSTMPNDIDAVYIATDPFLVEHSARIADAATQRGLISSAPHRDGVRDGALYSFSFDLLQLGKEVARLSDQVLKGVPPEDIPVEVSEFFLSVNMTTADRLGITIPDMLMRQALIYH